MEAAAFPIRVTRDQRDGAVGCDPILRRFSLTQPWAYVASVALTLLLLIADVLLPRGATAAIGYCLVPVIAVGTRRHRFTLGITIACTLLTWFGFLVEPPGGLWWISVFERGMVTLSLWVALVLVWRRVSAVTMLAHQTQALEDTTRELQRSNAELERFASVIAHDIRSPLNSVGLHAQLLAGHGLVRSDADCSESVESIRSQLEQIEGLIQRLLAYGRVGSGALRLSDCDCEAVLANVRVALRADLERSGGEVTNDPLPAIHADDRLIASLLQNLVENSIKYRGAASPRIHVSAKRRGGDWVFAVRDNGIGIRAEDLPEIFQPFRQSSAGGTKHGGVGLGLATCKRIVERHGGRIEAESAPGEGTTFLFSIPARAATASKS